MKSSSNQDKKRKYSCLAEMDYEIMCNHFGEEKAKQMMLLSIENHKESERLLNGIKSYSS